MATTTKRKSKFALDGHGKPLYKKVGKLTTRELYALGDTNEEIDRYNQECDRYNQSVDRHNSR